ncbi:ribosome binding protein [Babesia ovata]|uniref:Ribosome binding protein n=1 Tax=Babesia ovata TaxID=189622 RepID=A0A2H6KAP6_9APIC|nr:ribosome binding protein [Babesia ovata]GBE60055.1 ribosome binding protein [Babesia ovata]
MILDYHDMMSLANITTTELKSAPEPFSQVPFNGVVTGAALKIPNKSPQFPLPPPSTTMRPTGIAVQHKHTSVDHATLTPVIPQIDDLAVPSVLGSMNPLVSVATGDKIPGLNRGSPLPQLSTLKRPGQNDSAPNNSIDTLEFDDRNMADLTHITSEIIKTPIVQLPGHPNLGMYVTPEITGQPVADILSESVEPPSFEFEIQRRRETETAPNAKLQTPPIATQGFMQQPSRTTAPPVEWLEPAAPIEALPEIPQDAFGASVGPLDNVKTMSAADFLTHIDLNTSPDSDMCRNPWEMLYWMVGLNQNGYIPFIEEHLKSILREYNKDASQPPDALEVTGHPTQLTATRVANTLTEACLYAASVLHKIRYTDSKDTPTTLNFSLEYSKLHYSPDPACLFCQLRDYVYICHHQLMFLKSQCYREQSYGGWQDCHYGSDIKMPSPLQAFLTDASDSKFETHPFDPCNICLKSRIRMGFTKGDFSKDSKDGKHLHTILSPSCGGDDPLLRLSSYLNCLTRRTPRTTGELVSFFHHFGNALHKGDTKVMSPLGSALSSRHDDCPKWDRLKAADLHVIKAARGPAPHNSNSIHDQNHAKTLSALIPCAINSVNCPQHLSPITHQAYGLYSPSFAYTYLIWTVYLADKLHDSLERLYMDFENHVTKCESLDHCADAMPLLYYRGFTPPEGIGQSSLKCSDVISKLQVVLSGELITELVTCMDNFFYGIRKPFIYTQVTLWSIAMIFFAHTMFYRLDMLHIRSHLLTTTASHLIDVKSLLTHGRKLLSLYDDMDYFDDDPVGQLDIT